MYIRVWVRSKYVPNAPSSCLTSTPRGKRRVRERERVQAIENLEARRKWNFDALLVVTALPIPHYVYVFILARTLKEIYDFTTVFQNFFSPLVCRNPNRCEILEMIFCTCPSPDILSGDDAAVTQPGNSFEGLKWDSHLGRVPRPISEV